MEDPDHPAAAAVEDDDEAAAAAVTVFLDELLQNI